MADTRSEALWGRSFFTFQSGQNRLLCGLEEVHGIGFLRVIVSCSQGGTMHVSCRKRERGEGAIDRVELFRHNSLIVYWS